MRRIGSLFSGIGGLELGLERAGLGRVVWQVEQNAFCRAVLAKHWPGADRSVCDVRAATPDTLGPVDWIIGGPPCQDNSNANPKGAGLGGARSGLWFEMLRVIAAFRPVGVIFENVAHGRRRYLCPVRRSLHELGYNTTALLVSAEECGAPHVRDRCFIVAHAHRQPLRERPEREPARPSNGVRPEGQAEPGHARATSGRRDQSRVGRSAPGLSAGLGGYRWPARRGERPHEDEPSFTLAEPDPWQDERLTALGNSVMPVCAEVVGRWILQNLPPAE